MFARTRPNRAFSNECAVVLRQKVCAIPPQLKPLMQPPWTQEELAKAEELIQRALSAVDEAHGETDAANLLLQRTRHSLVNVWCWVIIRRGDAAKNDQVSIVTTCFAR